MRASPQITCLSLGSQTLRLARFRIQRREGLLLTHYAEREILPDASADESRFPEITGTLRELMSDLGVRAGPVSYAVSGRSVFTRFVRLPPIEEEKIERIIAFEAQQNVPFPMNEVVWDYQLLGSNATQQREVVLVAIKAALLEEMNGAIEAAGLQTSLVDVAPMALCNAFHFSYPELTDCSLLLDLGARSSSLIFVEPGKFFTRTIPFGGSSVTSALAREFEEPFAAAEHRKRGNAIFTLGAMQGEPQEQELLRARELTSTSMTRLYAEVARSISFYRTHQQGSQPSRVFLSGGGAGMPSLREFLQERLQVSIELFDPLRNLAEVTPLTNKGVPVCSYSAGELVGLALRRTLGANPLRLNLKPASVIQRDQLRKRQPVFFLAAACFLLGLLSWTFYFWRVAHVEAQLADELQVEVDRMENVEQRLDKLRREKSALENQADPLLDAVKDRGAWLQILAELKERLPKENIWITELAPLSGESVIEETSLTFPLVNPAGSTLVLPKGRATPPHPTQEKAIIDGVFVKGLYLSNPRQQEVVVDYFRNLVDSAVFQVDPNNQSQIIRPSTPTETEWAYPYELRLKLKRPIPLL